MSGADPASPASQASPASNADQIEYWNSTGGDSWTRNQQKLDAVLAPVSDQVLKDADIRPTDNVLDVGCGCGDTTLAIAARLKTGRAIGADISAPMLARAKDRAGSTKLPIEFIQADVATYSLEPGTVDLVFSRFGVMFFADPTAAFANIRKSLSANGRLTFACWRDMTENDWMFRPLAAALAHITPPEPPAPGAPGPFAFADPDRVRAILEGAGFKNITITPFDTKLTLGAPGAAASNDSALADALHFLTEIGPFSRLMADEPAENKNKAMAAVESELETWSGPDGIQLAAACWIVKADA